jgi:lysozyme
MSMNPVVTDLSHWNGAIDFAKVKASGILGVINKATQGTGNVDKTYAKRRKEAAKAGLLWGAYHFADASDVKKQVAHFLKHAAPDANTLLALDWEPNGKSTMLLDQAKEFCKLVYEATGQRPVIYSGNLIKEVLATRPDPFLSKHRLWLAQYGPKAKLPPGFDKYWLWQYTGDGIGNEPHSLPGVSSKVCDLNVFGGSDLAKEWCAGMKGDKLVIPAADPPKVKLPPIVLEAPKPLVVAAKESPSAGLGISGIIMLVFGGILDGFSGVWNFALSFIDQTPAMVSVVGTHVAASEQMAGWLGIPWSKISFGVVAALMAVMVVRNLNWTKWINRNPEATP